MPIAGNSHPIYVLGEDEGALSITTYFKGIICFQVESANGQ